MEQAHPNGVLLIRDSLDNYGLSPSAQKVLMASWRTGTTKQYHTYLKRWLLYCKENAVDVFRPGVNKGVEFLVSLFRSGLAYSAVNTARSALSSIIILSDGSKFGEHPLVCRCLKGIYELRPALPKYSRIWDVNIVLNFLKTLDFASELSLKDLSLKLTMFLCLTTAQRGQTICSFDVNYVQEFDDKYRITVMQKLKSSKPGVHLEPIELQAFKEDKKLCVSEHLKEYISRTRDLRNGQSQLLISYTKPHKPISRNTISRWTKQVIKSAGLDMTIYSSHSTRAASTSSCKAKGFSVEEIMKVAGWSTSGTFATFNHKPIDNTANFGSMVLQQ